MLILLTNDDGIYAPGLAALEAEKIRKIAAASPSDGRLADDSVSDLQIGTALKVGKLRASLRPYYR